MYCHLFFFNPIFGTLIKKHDSYWLSVNFKNQIDCDKKD